MKIFQIGFNRCGTSSLYDLFRRNEYISVHWKDGVIAKTMLSNRDSGLALLTGIDEYEFYSDMEYTSSTQIIEGYRWFKELDIQYSNSLFILNLRDKGNWIKSRLQHPQGTGTYIKRYCDYYNLSESDIIKMWSDDWDNHISDVRSYFSGSDRFLEFDIELDNPYKLYGFLIENGIRFKDFRFEKLNTGNF